MSADLPSTDKPEPQPFNWRDVALVAFDGDRPVIISSAEPHVLFDTFLSLGEDGERKHTEIFDSEQLNEARIVVQREIASLRWALYLTEDAKQVFCRPAQDERQRTLVFAD